MTNDLIKNEITKKLKLTKAPPILFVGSGLSQRYLGTPNWDQLLMMLSQAANDSSLAFEMYSSEASSMDNPYGINPKIAELIERDFNKRWYIDDKFKDSREKNIKFAKDKCSPLKIEIAQYFKDISYGNLKPDMEEEINLLGKVGDRSIGGVITTNYDCLIERIFSKYKYQKYVGQEELIFSAITGVAEIYKIHGCCTNPSSIVINERDYKKFNDKNAYLIAKLLTIFMEYPIIFLGYSISDSNIQDILVSISNCLPQDKIVNLKDRFIFIEWNNTSEDDEITTLQFSVPGKIKSITMTKVRINDYSCIYEALLENKVTYNPRLIKKLKNDIYNIVLAAEPSETLKVLVDIDDDKLDEIEAVVGFGVASQLGIRGYKSFTSEDLCEDLIKDKGLINKLIVEDSLPVILKTCRNVPMFKYLKDFKGEKPLNVKKWSEKINCLSDIYTKTIIRERRSPGGIINKSLADIRAESGIDAAFERAVYVNEEYINSIDLYNIIYEYMNKYPDCLRVDNQFKKNHLKRLIRMYDYLKYKAGK